MRSRACPRRSRGARRRSQDLLTTRRAHSRVILGRSTNAWVTAQGGRDMKTSLGIWALGPMVTRFVPGGYQPQRAGETTVERVQRAVEGLGDLIDGYEFHYPQELNEDNVEEIREALGPDHDIYCLAGGLHLDPRFGRGGLVNPDPQTRAEATRIAVAGADLAGRLGVPLIVWPGIEGYNYPFQTPYRESWDWFVDMNGENLAEYAALLAAEGVLGHQHANSGWGVFDDDNMVGATAFMETLELAVELRRVGYGDNGERLGFDLYPYTEDAVAAVRRSVLQWRFIDEVAARIDEAALREAQAQKDAVAAYEVVYSALGA